MENAIGRTRRSLVVIVAGGVAAALALSVTAVSLAGKSKTHKLSGSTKSIEGGVKTPDPNGMVSMKVKTNRGNKPKNIKDFAYEDLDSVCQSDFGRGRIETYADEKSGLIPVNVPVNTRSGKFSKKAAGDVTTVKLSGKVKKKGKKATGTLEAVQEGPDSLCTTEAKFKATK